jgi:hypothetical protein
VREAGVITSQAVLIAIGIDWDGRRQILAVIRAGILGRGAAVPMARNPAALHPDQTKRPRPHRPALVATPGANEWISRVSSPATNRSGRTPKKGAGNLANSRAALQIYLMIR